MGLASWGGQTRVYNTHISGFREITQTGMSSSVLGTPALPDWIAPIYLFNTTFTDVEEGAFALMMDPIPKWANIKDCGNFPCTAPNNVLLSFKDSKWEGATIDNPLANFQIIHDNDGFAPFVDGCERKETWNAYMCDKTTLGIVEFDSRDVDRMDRSVQPVNVSRQGTAMKNVLNSMMDHVWDGFYAGQIRQTRFPAVVDAELGSVYDIAYTGTPPKKQVFELFT